jgi:hypothetical protein
MLNKLYNFLLESKRTKLIRSALSQGYVKSVKSKEELKDNIKTHFRNNTMFLLHKDPQSGKLTKITINKNQFEKLECTSEILI